MPAGAAGAGGAGVDGVADQGVGEPEAADAVLAGQPGATATSRASSTSSSSCPAASATVSRSKKRPTTAATTSAERVASGSRSRRRETTSVTACGGSGSASRVSRSAASSTRRAYSTRKNGLPSVRVRSASAWPAEGRRADGLDDPATSAAGQPGQVEPESRAAGRAARRRRPGRPSGCGRSRQVATRVSRPRCTDSSSRPSTRSDEESDQCRSSRSTSTARPRGGRHRPDDVVPGPELAASAPPTAGAASVGRPRPRPSSTLAHGHSGGAPSSWEQRPTSTVQPRSSAAAASSASSRLLPIPGSPTTEAKVGVPSSPRRAG